MRIAIGILAHNEEHTIGPLVASLARQDLFATPGHSVSVHIVPNGCRDATTAAARKALEGLAAAFPCVRVAVHDVADPGKANAWNLFVHDFSEPEADALLLLDADIEFGQDACLRLVAEALPNNPKAVVAVDTPVKDVQKKAVRSLRERVSVAASEVQLSGPPKLTGHLYCARAAALREIWMPPGLLVEDGFLKAMLLTRGFSCLEQPDGIVRAEGASHFYQAEIRLSGWFRHERRILDGTAMNIILFAALREQVAGGRPVGEWIRQQNASDPAWVAKLVRERAPRGLPGGTEFLAAPLRQLRGLTPVRRIRAFPAAALRCALNLAVAIAARNDLKTGRLRW